MLPNKEKQPLGEDISSRRIGQLKSIVKHLVFFAIQSYSKNDVKAQSCDTTDKEIPACTLIANTVRLFLPPKEKYNIIAHQLYFCVWANDVLKHARYSKFTIGLHPSTTFSLLNALHLNAPTLYQLLTQELTKVDQDQSSDQEGKPASKLVVYGYDQQPITSLEFARQNKDAVFNAIFNMGLLHTSCKSYGLDFAHRVICLPSLKTVSTLGTQEKMVNILNKPKKAAYEERVLKNPNVILEGQKPKESLSAEIKSLSDVIKQLEGELKKTLNFQNESDFSGKIRTLKNQWEKGNNDKLHEDIETLKIA